MRNLTIQSEIIDHGGHYDSILEDNESWVAQNAGQIILLVYIQAAWSVQDAFPWGLNDFLRVSINLKLKRCL